MVTIVTTTEVQIILQISLVYQQAKRILHTPVCIIILLLHLRLVNSIYNYNRAIRQTISLYIYHGKFRAILVHTGTLGGWRAIIVTSRD